MELLYGNIALIRRLMNDGPRSVRVPRLNLIRALKLAGGEHDGMPCRMCARVGEGKERDRGRVRDKSSNEARVRRGRGKRRKEGSPFPFENAPTYPSRRRSWMTIPDDYPIVMQMMEQPAYRL